MSEMHEVVRLRAVVLCVSTGWWLLLSAPAAAQADPHTENEATDDKAPQLTRAPQVKVAVTPEYPVNVRVDHDVQVVLALELDAAGLVTKAEVTGAAQAGFDEAALEAAQRMTFTPAEVDGKPAAIRISYRYLFAAPPPPPPVTVPRLFGQVVFADGKPAVGVRVSLKTTTTEQAVVTDAEGRFDLGEVAPGAYAVHLSSGAPSTNTAAASSAAASSADSDIVATVVEQRVDPAMTAGVVYTVALPTPGADRIDEEIVVRSSPPAPAGGATLTTDAGRSVAGSMGDALNVVQSLPGVAASPSGSGELVVWGATPGETRVYIDDVPVPALYHRGGFRSVMHDGLVSGVEVVPAAFGPEYGRGTGGIVRVETAPVEGSGVHGEVAADFIGASVQLETNPSAGFGAVGAARAGYLDLLLPAVAPEAEYVIPISAYRDYAAKARFGGVRDGDKANTSRGADTYSELSVFGSFDDVQRTLPTTDPASQRTERDQESFHRVSLRHVRHGRNVEDRLGVWMGVDLNDYSADFSNVATSLSTQSYRYGGRASREFLLQDSLSITLGAEFEGRRSDNQRRGTLGLPAREGDVVAFGQSPATQIGADDWTVDVVGLAGYLAVDWRPLGDALQISPSVRAEPIVQLGDRVLPAASGPPIGYSQLDLALAPRLAVNAKPADTVTLQAATGLYHQPATATDLSPVFGGTALDLTRAAHGLLGARVEPAEGTALEATAFAKYGWDLVMRNTQEPPPVAGALVNSGQSRTWGGQFSVRQELLYGVSGWLSYTLSRAERKNDESTPWRLSDFDQPHLFTGVLNYVLSEAWSFGARARAASGLPRTEVTGAYYDARIDRYQPLFGAQNQAPLPLSFQLDLHAEWSQRWETTRLGIYLDVINVTNQRNPVERVYSYDYGASDTLNSLPLLAVLGARLEF